MTMSEHDLKTWPDYFEAIRDGSKTFEIRLDDRGFKVGDVLWLQEWDNLNFHYTGRSMRRRVTYVLRDFGLAANHVCLGLALHGSEAGPLDTLANRPELRQKGWDSYTADPLDDRAVAAARAFLGYEWNAVPTIKGGIQLEMHTGGFDVELEWNETGAIESVYAETVEDQKKPIAEAGPQEAREALGKLKAERDYLFDLPLCRRQLPDGTVPGCTEEALSAWFHIAQDALQQVRVLGSNGTYNWKERAERAERELARAGSEAGVSARVLEALQRWDAHHDTGMDPQSYHDDGRELAEAVRAALGVSPAADPELQAWADWNRKPPAAKQEQR
jgi:hypothetical protein